MVNSGKLRVLNWEKIREQGLSLRLIWDLFMIFLAVVNLGLIAFDLTYLWLRPQYFQYATGLTDLYDPVKGIYPHPMIERYFALVDRLPNITSPEKRQEIQEKLLLVSQEMLRHDAFVESGQTTNLIQAQNAMRAIADIQPADEDMFVTFWSLDELDEVKRRTQFNDQVRPLLKACYARKRSLSGHYVDRFLLLDLPFLILFVVEFLVRWAVALRRKTYQKWFVFPFYNWYEILGLIPLVQFRVFRLFRIASIYLRLRRSELTRIGEDFITRKIKRYSDIITEEIADRVAVRILSEIQEEIRSGTSVEIIQSALLAKQKEVKKAVLQSIRQTMSDPIIVENLSHLVQNSLKNASSQFASLKMVPRFIKETVTRDIGLAIFHAIIQSLSHPIPNAQDKDALEDILDKVLDDILRSLGENNAAQLFQDIALLILENTKQVVARKKWLEEKSE